MTIAPNPRPPGAGTEFASRELDVPYPSFPELLPGGEVTAGRYTVRFARSVEDLDQIERLRFQVFNLELGEGLDSAFATGRDHDEHDPHFHHLLIACAEPPARSSVPIGCRPPRWRSGVEATTRPASSIWGACRASFWPAVEVGRACVARGHRNGRVLNLLWRGLALYLARNQKRHVFGCCSLTSQDAALGQATMVFLEREGHVHPSLYAPPLPGLGCAGADPASVATRCTFRPSSRATSTSGQRFFGPPAIDRYFKTIDFLVVLDVPSLDEHSYRFFFR